MIHEVLNTGRENATTCRQLADHFRCESRDITKAIESERRQGIPICAAVGDPPGYFLPADRHELQTYCDQLKHREKEIAETRRALVRTLRACRDKKS